MKTKDINVLHITRTMGLGGTEKVIMQLCESFKDDFKSISVASLSGEHVKALKNMGIEHYNIEDVENKSITNIFKTFLVLRKILKENEINLIHTHHRMTAFYGKILSHMYGVKWVHTAHNTFKDKKFFTRFILNNEYIVPVGNKVKENLIEFYKIKNNNNKIRVIYNGISDKFEKKEIKILIDLKKSGFFIVGNIGRLSTQKGFEYFVKSIPNIIAENKNVRFVIVGDGELKEDIENLINTLNINEYVINLGYRKDVLNVMSHLDLVVLSSLWEGLPLTPIEAFSVSKPVVATNVDGNVEIVEDNFNGLIINSKSEKEICDAVLKLINDKELLNQCKKNSIVTYEKKFSYKSFIENYKKFFDEIIRGI